MGLPTAYQPVYGTVSPPRNKQTLSKVLAVAFLALLAFLNSSAAPDALEDLGDWLKSFKKLPRDPRERALALLEISPVIGELSQRARQEFERFRATLVP